MKILITTDLYKPQVNGVVTSVLNLVDELTKNGHEVKILTVSTYTKSYKEGNVYYIKSLPIKIYPDVRMPFSYHNRYINELIDWQPDVIHSQCEFFSFQFAKHISDKTGAPIIHTYHTLYEQYAGYVLKSQRLSNKMIALLSRERLKNVETVIAPTAKVSNSLNFYGLKNHIEIIPTGIELNKHNSTPLSEEKKIAMKEELNIPIDNHILVYVGRIGTEKNIQEIIYNFEELLHYECDITLVIVGDGPAREDLEQLTYSLDISEHVVFTGMVDSSKVSDYYKLGDIFVCASTSETQGLTYIEAVANGTPLVCRKDPCLDNVIFDGQNGYQYTNTNQFVEQVEGILSNPSWRKGALEFNRKIVDSFSKEHFAESINHVYSQVTKKG